MGQGYDASMREWQVMGRKPDQSYTYGYSEDTPNDGKIDGDIHPNFSHLSDPRITLEVSSGKTNIMARITFEAENSPERVQYSSFNPSLQSDGTFSRFSDDGTGINGIIYGDYKSREQRIAGHVVTSHVYGTYIAGR